jgi:hypothetical protein
MVNRLALWSLLAWHPLHSSAAQVQLPPAGGPGEVTVRVFAEDFPPGQDSTLAAQYLSTRFHIADGNGRAMPLTLRSMRRDGAVLILSLTMIIPPGFAGGSIWHGVLAERFDDQVNLVQVRHGARTATLLFSRGDGPKPLP